MSKMAFRSKIEQAIPDLERFKVLNFLWTSLKNLAKFENENLVKSAIRLHLLLWRRIPNDWILLHEEGASECPGMGTVIK